MAAPAVTQPAGSRVSIANAIAQLGEPWQPADLAVANATVLRLALLHGAFPWHHHDEDELFLCWQGNFRIELQGAEPVELHPGELFVVPQGTEHRPIAEERAVALVIECIETKQYGN